jgi:hypothetical protein
MMEAGTFTFHSFSEKFESIGGQVPGKQAGKTQKYLLVHPEPTASDTIVQFIIYQLELAALEFA